MKRRDFLKNTTTGVVLPGLIGGYSVRAFGQSPLLDALTAAYVDTDHVLVLVQLNGGNDGLNMVIPIDQYSNLSAARNNILIAQNKVLALNGTTATGLHPAMTGLQQMYNNGRVTIVQGVSYPSPNYSHFRATDIWLTASDSNVDLNSGWGGRYLNTEYPNFPIGYPNTTMPDPLAIQIGSVVSPALQGSVMNMGMAIQNPTTFNYLMTGTIESTPPTPAGKELAYVRLIAQQTQAYAGVVKTAANKVTSQGTYPTPNPLADQLKIVARLIAGGLKTRIYMVNYGGFDTHSVQVQTSDTSLGTHANLLKTVSDAIKAFSDDCDGLGIADRVVGMTFSEFGRRVKSNAGIGTDHGAAAPLFVFGKPVKGGTMVGVNPTIPATVSVNDNVPMQYDFRSVYSTILKDWFCVNSTDLNTIMLKNFQNLPLINSSNCATGIHNANQVAGKQLISNYPNPFVSSTTVTFETMGGHTMVSVFDMMGKEIAVLVDGEYEAGTYSTSFNASGLAPGNYYARLQNGMIQQVRTMMIVR